MAGWVYVMSNPAMPGLLKVGMSSKDPSGDRVREPQQGNRVPQPFAIEYQALVDDERAVEASVFAHFKEQRISGKEFLQNVGVAEIVDFIARNFTVRTEDDHAGARQKILEAERRAEEEEKQARIVAAHKEREQQRLVEALVRQQEAEQEARLREEEFFRQKLP